MKIANGQVAGNSIRFGKKVIYEFLGIPFAEAPIGDLRFVNPGRLASEWNGIRDAKQYGPACMQQPKKGKVYSEDCLHLNVWTPEGNKDGKRKHVMVYFHGGSFNMGSASEAESNGTVLAAVHDVVIVTANYRLGFLGYLYPDDDVNSNMGQRDQQMALQWVRENIHAFGGEASSVSVFGHSAGAISAGILSLSPLTNSLFDRAILQSGSPYSFLRPDSVPTAQTKSLRLSRFLNCSSGRLPDERISQPVLRCLQAAPAESILSLAPQETIHSLILPNPVFGDSFLPSSVPSLLDKKLQESDLRPVDLIIGFQEEDAELFLMAQAKNVFGKRNHDNEVTKEQALKILSNILNRKLSDSEQEKMIKHYLPDDAPMTSKQLNSKMIRLYGDLYIYCPSYFHAEALVRSSEGKAKVFMYELRSKMSKPKNKQCLHTCHGEEIPIVFGTPFLRPDDYDDADRHLSGQVMNHWTQFAKTGCVIITSHESANNQSFGNNSALPFHAINLPILFSFYLFSPKFCDRIRAPDEKWIPFNESRKYLMLGKSDDARHGEMSDEKFANCDSFWRSIFDARK